MKQVSANDATFYYAEGDNTYAHGTFAWFYDGTTTAAKDFARDDLLRHVASRLHVSDILTQKLTPVPLHLDFPYWVTDPEFNLANHIHEVSLAGPGSWHQFTEAYSRVHSTPLPMDRPLWEIHLIRGLNDVDWLPAGAFALLAKFHHVAIDGATGMSIISGLHDLTAKPTAKSSASRKPNKATSAPGWSDMLTRSIVNNIRGPLKLARLAGQVAGDLPKLLPNIRLQNVMDIGKAPATLFNQPISDRARVRPAAVSRQ